MRVERPAPTARRVFLTAMVAGAACIGVSQPLCAQGGPPLVTDDPGTPGNGHVELNLSIEADRTADGTGYDAPRADLNVGAGARLQLKAELPWRVASGPGRSSESGLGNVSVGVKWRFFDRGEDGLTISTFPQLTLPGSRSASARGVADAETSVLLPVQVAWPLGPLRLNADAGWERSGGASALIFGLAGSRLARPWLELLGECHAEADTGISGVGVLCGFGARGEVGSSMRLLGALAWGVSGPADRRLDRRIYAGAQLRQ